MMKVSVVILTYNHKDFIAQAIEGTLMQVTDFPYEIIIGEDESQDGTRRICIDYAERYPDKIRLLLRSRKDVIYINGRPTGRFNFVESLKAARGKYIALCEGDDYWTDPLKLQKQVDLLEAHPDYAFCFHRTYRLVQATGQIEIWKFGRQPIKSAYSLEDIVGAAEFMRTGSIMFRNGLIAQFPAWFYSIPVGDFPLLVLLAQYGKGGFIDQAMSVYRVHGGGVMGGARQNELYQMLMSTVETVRNYLGPEYEKPIRRGICNILLTMAAFSADRGDLASARAYFLRSMVEYPLNPETRIADKLVLLGRLYAPSVYTASKRFWASLGHA